MFEEEEPIQVVFLGWDRQAGCLTEVSITPGVPTEAPQGACAVAIWVDGVGEVYHAQAPSTPSGWDSLHQAYAQACARL